MNLNYWAPHLTVAAIIEQNGKFLLVEENSDDAIVINQPAGHVEDGESPEQAVIRETFEETAHHLNPEFITGLYQWRHPNDETYLRICYAGNSTGFDAQQALDSDIIQTLWLSYEELKAKDNLRSPLVLKSIEDYVNGCHYPLNFIQEIK